MTLPSIADRRALAAIAIDAARDAATLVARGWRTRPTAEHKGRIDLVTSFDRDSEELLRARLTRDTEFPFVGEEQGATAGTVAADGATPTWYVDPLDGTTNFVHGHPFYCVSIGLLAGDEPLVGAVVAPALGVEWVGVVGEGATRNGAACRVSDVASFGESLLATGFPYDRATSADNNFDAFVSIKKRCQAVRRCGSAAMDLCFVGDGTYDGYWERKLRPWDLAAGAAIVMAAGGRISRYDGGPADVATGHLVATNGKIHEALIAALADVTPRA